MDSELKYEGIAIGRRIRAYDFQPREGQPEYFIEGEIIGIHDEGYKGYRVKVERDTTAIERPSGEMREEVIVPMEVSILEYDGRVRIIG